jgi:hypothetical protein
MNFTIRQGDDDDSDNEDDDTGDEGRKKKRKAAPSSRCRRQHKRRGSGWAESNDRQANEVADDVSHVSAELEDAQEAALRIHALNQKKDELFGHLTGNTPKGVVWCLKEASFMHGISAGRQLATSTRPHCPPKEFDDEPIGLEFMHCRDWDKIQKMLKHESAFNNGGVELPFGDKTVGLDDDDDDIGPDAAALTDNVGRS